MLGLVFVEMLYRMRMFSTSILTQQQKVKNEQPHLYKIIRNVINESLDDHQCSPAEIFFQRNMFTYLCIYI